MSMKLEDSSVGRGETKQQKGYEATKSKTVENRVPNFKGKIVQITCFVEWCP